MGEQRTGRAVVTATQRSTQACAPKAAPMHIRADAAQAAHEFLRYWNLLDHNDAQKMADDLERMLLHPTNPCNTDA